MSEAVINKPNWVLRIFSAMVFVPIGLLVLFFIVTDMIDQNRTPAQKASVAASEAQYQAARSYEQFRAIAQSTIRASMNDPASTQFRNVRQGATSDVVCGEVNARNGFGGYGAFRFFYARSTPSPITPQLEIQPQRPQTRAELDSFIANYKSNCGPL